MSFFARIVLDSVSPENVRLTSVEARYPRFIHAEIMTHRDRARNAASSRAIPWKRKAKAMASPEYIREIGGHIIGKGRFSEISLDPNELYEYYVPNCMYTMIMQNPVIPLSFDAEQKGMQSGEAVSSQEEATTYWLDARNDAVKHADRLAALGIHKSIVNRIVESWMWITTLMTATEWKNFFRLRCHPMAEKHFQKIAGMIRDEMAKSVPVLRLHGQHHCPYLSLEETIALNKATQYDDMKVVNDLRMASTGRCARLSYLTHDGVRDIAEDIRLGKQLIDPASAGMDDDVMHASPLEHIAMCTARKDLRSGPFRQWKQYRKEFPRENVEG